MIRQDFNVLGDKLFVTASNGFRSV